MNDILTYPFEILVKYLKNNTSKNRRKLQRAVDNENKEVIYHLVNVKALLDAMEE